MPTMEPTSEISDPVDHFLDKLEAGGATAETYKLLAAAFLCTTTEEDFVALIAEAQKHLKGVDIADDARQLSLGDPIDASYALHCFQDRTGL